MNRLSDSERVLAEAPYRLLLRWLDLGALRPFTHDFQNSFCIDAEPLEHAAGRVAWRTRVDRIIRAHLHWMAGEVHRQAWRRKVRRRVRLLRLEVQSS